MSLEEQQDKPLIDRVFPIRHTDFITDHEFSESTTDRMICGYWLPNCIPYTMCGSIKEMHNAWFNPPPGNEPPLPPESELPSRQAKLRRPAPE